MAEKLIFPIGFDLEDGVKQVEKDWANAQKRLQKTIDKNPLKLDLKLSSKDLDITGLKDYIRLANEAGKANKELAKTRSEVALARQRESRTRVQEATELDQIRQKQAQAEMAEIRLTNAKNNGATATRRQNKAYGTQLTYIQRLMQRLAIVGGLYQAIGFVTRIREVTAEFELQRVALGAIIKDGYEASKMFEQIKAAAVKSPFEIKDLVSYTKQLAAYKIETKDLFDTTMQLADISAGLGVGMERLVLAFGQIRATGYLRAAEVRQLTEAGIPIVEELAKKLSAVRGELVSAGDVMQMISERAISFGMVKEVFDDMTSAGGTFYKMQEKQAETLAGQWSNLKDTLSIMYDEIGRSSFVQGLLQGFIDSTKTLASNWQTVRNVLGVVGALYAGFKIKALLTKNLAAQTQALATATTKYSTAWKQYYTAAHSGDKAFKANAKALLRQEALMVWAAKGTTKLSRAFRTLWATIAANPIGAVITAVMLLGSILYSAWENATKLDRELAKIGSEGTMQADQQVRNFERLAKAINENTVGSKKHDDALQELKRTYGELLPARDKDILALVKEKSAHEAITQAIREKIAVQMREQKINAITSHYGEDLAKEESNIKQTLKSYGFAVDEIAQIMSRLRDEIEKGNIQRLVKYSPGTMGSDYLPTEDWEKFIAILREFKDVEDTPNLFRDLVRGYFTWGYEDLQDYVTVYAEYYAKMQDVSAETENLTGLTGKLKKEWEDLQNRIGEIKGEGIKGTFDYEKSETEKKIIEYRNFIAKTLSDNKIVFTMEEDIDLRGLTEAIQDATPQVRKAINMAIAEYRKLIPSTDFERLIKQKWQEIAETTGASMDKWKNYFYDSEKDVKDFAKEIKDALEKLETDLAVLNKEQGAFEQYGVPYADKTQEIEQAKKNITALGIMLEFLQPFLDTNKDDAKALSDLKKQIQDVTNAYKKYIELRKYMSKEDALENIAMFFPSLGNFEPTYENMVAKLQKLKDEVRAKLAKDPTDTTLIDMSRELEKALANINFDKLKTDFEQKLARLSEDVAKTKTAKNFYDKILGITGDKQLSATFTMSVYGETGEGLADAVIQEVETAFKDVDVSSAINKSLKTVDLSTLRGIYKSLPEDFSSEQKKRMKEVLNMLETQQSNIAESFAKILMDYDEMEQKRITITHKATQEIATLEKGLALQIEAIRKDQSIVDKDAAIKQATARAEAVKQAIKAKEELELRKLDTDYIRFFSSINTMTMDMANKTRTNLRRALFDAFEKGGISAEELRKELKAIDTQFNKLNENASIFTSYLTGGFDGLLSHLRSSADEIDAVSARMMKLKSLDEMDESDKNFINKMLNIFGDKGQKSLSELAKSFNGDMNKMGNAVQEVGGKMQGMFSNAAGAISIVDMIIKAVHQTVAAFEQILDQINSMRSEDNQIGSWFKYISDFDKYAMSGWEKLKSGDGIGAIADTASSIISIFQNIQSDKMKRLNEEIENQEKLLNELNYSYGRLEKSLEDALNSEYVSLYNSKIQNLYAQIEAYEKQAQLERDKGKAADNDKIKEYEDTARETADNIKDMRGDLAEHFAGTDLTSAAKDLARSWIEAKKEVGDATKAIEERITEIIENLVLEAGAAEIAKRVMQPFFDEIEKLSKDKDGLTTSEIATLAKMIPQLAEDANVGLTNYFEALKAAGYDITKNAGELTGISKDIATASEESILGLAAGINTQNFYISQIHANVALITQWVQSGGMATQGVNVSDLITLQNQHLSHLPNIAANTAGTLAECKAILAETTRIANRLDSVIKPQGVKTTHTLHTSL